MSCLVCVHTCNIKVGKRNSGRSYITDDCISVVSAINNISSIIIIIKQILISNTGISSHRGCLSVNAQQVACDQHQHTPTDDYGVDERGRITNETVEQYTRHVHVRVILMWIHNHTYSTCTFVHVYMYVHYMYTCMYITCTVHVCTCTCTQHTMYMYMYTCQVARDCWFVWLTMIISGGQYTQTCSN